MKVKINYVGNIKLDKKVIVSDPCYDDTASQWRVELNNMDPGDYHCFVREYEQQAWNDETKTYMKPSILFVVNDDCYRDINRRVKNLSEFFASQNGLICERVSHPIGVDSGQAGIYDYEYYQENKAKDLILEEAGKYNDDNSWYWGKNAITTLSDPYYGLTDDKGVVSRTSYGDGEYSVYIWKANDTVEAIAIDFGGEPDTYRNTVEVKVFDAFDPIVDENGSFESINEAIRMYHEQAALDTKLGRNKQIEDWLAELRDIRQLITSPLHETLIELLKAEDNGPATLKEIYEAYDPEASEDLAECAVHFWLGQLIRARERIGKEQQK